MLPSLPLPHPLLPPDIDYPSRVLDEDFGEEGPSGRGLGLVLGLRLGLGLGCKSCACRDCDQAAPVRAPNEIQKDGLSSWFRAMNRQTRSNCRGWVHNGVDHEKPPEFASRSYGQGFTSSSMNSRKQSGTNLLLDFSTGIISKRCPTMAYFTLVLELGLFEPHWGGSTRP
ncbi:hypothetical protein AG1IA_08434 [Rhizoctonia solani AG-1 IA]|uniref:Uncharacterized protein n=1 Tax=Thanatephorus cucumeris (strain AG1-IA) TaxID=983506 RepID=L8WH52_THACA|nr:hypothetical protein AG1IA_08434 [Rhizoctonia solani AG-1 IA]